MDSPTPRAETSLRATILVSILGSVLSTGLLFAHAPAVADSARLYQWTDEQGVVRYTPDRGRVPGSRRETMLTIEPGAPTTEVTEAPRAADEEQGPSRPPSQAAPQPGEPSTSPPPLPVRQASEQRRGAVSGEASVVDSLLSRPPSSHSDSVLAMEPTAPATPALETPAGSGLESQKPALERPPAPMQPRSQPAEPETNGHKRAFAPLRTAAVGPLPTRSSRSAVAKPAAVGPYVIQLRARTSDDLDPLPPLDLVEGYRLYSTRLKKNGQVWTRLRLGFFPTRTAAEEMRERLEPSFPGAWITQVTSREQVRSSQHAIPPSR